MNIFKRFYISLFKPKRYKELLNSSGFSTFLYLLIFSFIIGLLAFSRNYTNLNKFFYARKEAIEKKIPKFEIKDGVLNLKGANFVVFQEENCTFILNDKESSSTLLDEYASGIALGKDSLTLKYNNTNLGTTDYSSMNLSLTDQKLKDYIEALDNTLGNTYLTFMVLSFIIFAFVSSFILAIIGKIIAKVKNINLSFSSFYKLSIYGITPCLVIIALLNLLDINMMLSTPLSFLVSIIYIYFGILNVNIYTFGSY